MKHLIYYIKLALKPSLKNIICILSLAFGLSLSLVLFGNVLYERSFDNFHDNKDRTYLINAHYFEDQKESGVHNSLPIMVIPKIFAEIPEIEIATQFYDRPYEYTLNNNVFKLDVIEVDSLFFDVFSFEVLQGNPKEDFKNPGTIYLSQSKAYDLFGNINPIGQILKKSKTTMTVKGIYKDFPANSIITSNYGPVDALESFAKYKIRGGLFGGDRYKGMVVLRDGISELFVEQKIQELLERELPPSYVGLVQYRLRPLADEHSNSKSVKQATMIMSLVALLLLVISALNNSLISLSSMSLRLKEIAIHKCNGAKRSRIILMIFTETAVQTLVALILATFFIYAFQNKIASLFAPIDVIFSIEHIWGMILVVLLMLIVSSIIPCVVLSNIPIVTLFTSSKNSNKLWKKIMLFMQLFFTISLISVAFIAVKQYDYMLYKDLGYNCSNLIYTEIELENESEFDKYTAELKSLNCVDGVSYDFEGIVMSKMVGYGVSEKGMGSHLFSTRALTSSSAIFDTHKLEFVDGEPFRDNSNDFGEVVINERFIEMMNWDKNESVIGKTISVWQEENRVVGVVKNFETTPDISATNYEPIIIRNIRPLMRKYNNEFPTTVSVSILLNDITPENIELVRLKLLNLNSENDNAINSYIAYRSDIMKPFEKQVTGLNITSFIILLISAMGLFGFISNELQFKYREIALRRIYGATISNIIMMTYRPIAKLLYVAIPFALFVSYYLGSLFIERNFPDTTPIFWWMLLFPVLFVIFISLFIVFAKTFGVARENPIKTISK